VRGRFVENLGCGQVQDLDGLWPSTCQQFEEGAWLEEGRRAPFPAPSGLGVGFSQGELEGSPNVAIVLGAATGDNLGDGGQYTADFRQQPGGCGRLSSPGGGGGPAGEGGPSPDARRLHGATAMREFEGPEGAIRQKRPPGRVEVRVSPPRMQSTPTRQFWTRLSKLSTAENGKPRLSSQRSGHVAAYLAARARPIGGVVREGVETLRWSGWPMDPS